MGLFRRPDDGFDDELRDLQWSIQHRGQAQIAVANARTSKFIGEVLVEAGAYGSTSAQQFATEWLRYFLAFGTVGWFKLLDPLPEARQLRAEFIALVQDRERFGPGHIMAWWWHLKPSLFMDTVEHQLGQMRGALTDNVRSAAEHEDFSNLPSWELFAA